MIENYSIKLRFNFKTLDYEGEEIVTGNFSSDDNLDYEGLDIIEAKADLNKKCSVHRNRISINNEGKGNVYIKFKGKVSEKSLMGIHKSSYENGYIITTQMEPTGARMVFPCKDTPAEKAVFKMEIFVDDDVEVITNTLPEYMERDGKSSHYIFKETPKMSTYLIYIGIGKFERISEVYNNKKLSVITTPGKSQQGAFALNLLKRILDEYEKYYEIIGCPKIDMMFDNRQTY